MPESYQTAYRLLTRLPHFLPPGWSVNGDTVGDRLCIFITVTRFLNTQKCIARITVVTEELNAAVYLDLYEGSSDQNSKIIQAIKIISPNSEVRFLSNAL